MKSGDEKRSSNWLVYVLHCADGSFYTGATNCLAKRIIEHNRGSGSKYTRSRRPVFLLAASAAMTKSDALRLEIKIKRLPKFKKILCLNCAHAGEQ